ncbi:DUF3299 domain-containing protein [Acuticoccus sp. M5D2P5]|uniref:DUF3299 domain-containing protein n=1 Tax=Acuticoccus kalidii TaxID=2910977 RepID=UPI001F18C434|nr:DUF3299 domain-containing protein [Acuticoccus kalidii]MCF3932687.1 DUF3299 domain-containing protein [Acuticoccus kalidii]
MLSLAIRLAVVIVAVVAIGVFVVAPWESNAPEIAGAENADDVQRRITVIDADGNPIDDAEGYSRVPAMDGAGPHELVRYEMPPPKETPPLDDGAADLTWPSLWKDGAFSMDAPDGDRVGSPDQSLFPEGSSAEDVMNFFLDMDDMRSLQPLEGAIRADLDGKRVRIAGYTTPVGFSDAETSFLLVPELGACIHVPPPPPNQIVYVEKAAQTPEMFAPVWITGTLKAQPVATILADVGYQMVDVTTEPYN